MRMISTDYRDQSAGTIDDGQFVQEVSAKTFYMFLSGIAKNKIRYPLQEYCTNAHEAAPGNWELHLPTLLSPIVRIRDYGPGLNHQDLVRYATTIGASSKDQDDNAIGGWGAGMKSAFAYVVDFTGGSGGSYTIRSFQDGQVRTYIMSMGADGVPSWKLFAEEPTQEPSGLEISFAVKEEDVGTFEREAKSILWSFDPKPLAIYPDLNFDQYKLTEDVCGNDWYAFDTGASPINAPHATMGGVNYPINFNLIDKANSVWRQAPIVFKVPIGSLSVSASREELAYDPRTKKTLVSVIERFEAEFIKSVESRFAKASSFIDACAVFEGMGMNSRIKSLIRDKAKFKGQSLGKVTLPDESFCEIKLHRGSMVGSGFVFDNIVTRRLSRNYNSQSLDVYTPHTFETGTIAGFKNRKFIIERNPSYSLKRMYAAGLKDDDAIVWFRCTTDRAETRVLNFLKAIGAPSEDIIHLKDYKVSLGKRETSHQTKTQVKVWKWDAKDKGWRSSIEDIELKRERKTRLFVRPTRRITSWRSSLFTFESGPLRYMDVYTGFKGFLDDFSAFNKASGKKAFDTIYEINGNDLKKINKLGLTNWKPVGTQVFRLASRYIQREWKPEVSNPLDGIDLGNVYGNDKKQVIIFLKHLEKALPDNLKTFVTDIEAAYNSFIDSRKQGRVNGPIYDAAQRILVQHSRGYGEKFINQLSTAKEVNTFAGRWGALVAKYPILTMFLTATNQKYTSWRSDEENIALVPATYWKILKENLK